MDLKTVTGNTPKYPHWLHPAIWLVACLLLALVQMSWAGYQLGVGNQGIQIAFLQKLHDAELFRNDAMVRETLASYPSFFFHLIARLLTFTDLSNLYLFLHVVATAGVFAMVIALSGAMTRNRWAGLVCALFLLGGHHQALAGESLYSQGFTHTWAIFPLSLFSLYLFFRDRHVMAFLLAGLIFNFHALEAGHLLIIMGLASFFEIRAIGLRQLLVASGAFVFAALPTVLVMVGQAVAAHRMHESYSDPLWLQLMYIRSFDHSFPLTWWHSGNPDVPRFISVVGLAAVALSFRLPQRMKGKAGLILLGIGLLFLAGVMFTDVWPVPLVIRAQFFRSSRLLYVLSLIVIANACVRAWKLPWHRPATMAKWGAWAEFASASLTVLCMAVPSLMPFAPWALAIALLIALLNGRLAWYEALFAGVVLLVCLLATQKIDFVIPGIAVLGAEHRWLFTRVQWSAFLENHWPSARVFAGGALALGLAVAALRWRSRLKTPLVVGGILAGGLFVFLLLPGIRKMSAVDPAWVDAQVWVRDHTPKSAVVLTPPAESGFRIFSQRSVVGEWRDGTQLYFKAGFAKPWWDAMNALQPNKVVRADKKDLENRGIPLEKLEDEKIVRLATDLRTRADYIVLPKVEVDGVKANTHGMKVAYQNDDWVIFEPKFMDFAGSPGDATLVEEDNFIRQVVLPGIERNRKSDVRLALVDSAGKPLQGIDFRIAQTNSAFGFGVSLPFFQVPNVDTKADYKPPQVTSGELEKFLEAFNYSVIPFSGQWRFTEPAEGRVDYADLDKYVDWCVEHHIRPEFRFLAGYQPAWVKGKIARDQGNFILSRAQALAKRYDGKINDWQVTSEDVGLREIGMEEYDPRLRVERVTAFFTALRKALPTARLGISDDARFFSAKTGVEAKPDMQRGIETLRAFKRMNVNLDYMALEGKHPLGSWAAGKSVYETLDAFAKEGVKLHITELGVAVGDRIEGTVREGTWTPQLQAEYYERFFTLCYGHPAVEVVNLMGMGDATWRPGQGMLDAAGLPTPAYNKLKEMITQRWRTRLADKFGAGGTFNYRGYQGSYELTVALPGGRSVTANFDVMPPAAGIDPAAANSFRFVLGADGTLKRVEEK